MIRDHVSGRVRYVLRVPCSVRRSLRAEVITLLEWATEEVEHRRVMTLDAIRARRCFNPAAAGAPDSTTLLREDRAR